MQAVRLPICICTCVCKSSGAGVHNLHEYTAHNVHMRAYSLTHAICHRTGRARVRTSTHARGEQIHHLAGASNLYRMFTLRAICASTYGRDDCVLRAFGVCVCVRARRNLSPLQFINYPKSLRATLDTKDES